MELFFALFLLAGILGVPLFCLVSGGIALSRGRGGWGRIVCGALWLGLVGIGCLAAGGGGAPGGIVAVAVVVVAFLSVAPLGLLVSGIVAAASRRGGRWRIAFGAVWLAAAAALVLYSRFRDERILGRGTSPDGREWCVVQTEGSRPSEVRLYLRDASGDWVLAAEDTGLDPWKSASVAFPSGEPLVFDGENRLRTLPRPAVRDAGDPAAAALARLPASYAPEDVLRACRRAARRLPRDDGRPSDPRDLRARHWVGRWILHDSVKIPGKRHFQLVPCAFFAPDDGLSAVTLAADGTASATNWALGGRGGHDPAGPVPVRYPSLRGEWKYHYQTNDDLAVVSVSWRPPDDGGFPRGYGSWEDSYYWAPVHFSSPGFGHLRADRDDPAHDEIEYLVLDEPWNRP